MDDCEKRIEEEGETLKRKEERKEETKTVFGRKEEGGGMNVDEE